MIKCNWLEGINELFSEDTESDSFTARDFTASQQEGSEESLEINGSISYSVSTCRTAELYSNAGYLQSVRGNCIHDDEYTLFEFEPVNSKDIVRVKFLSNSHSPKSTVYFRQLTVVRNTPTFRSSIDTSKVREILKHLPHNEKSSTSVLTMMDTMPPFLSMMCSGGNPAAFLDRSGTTNSGLDLRSLACALDASPDIARDNARDHAAPGMSGNCNDSKASTSLRDDFKYVELLNSGSPLDENSILGSIASKVESASVVSRTNNKSCLSTENDKSMNASAVKRIEMNQQALKDDIIELKSELNQAKIEILQTVADSESRILQILSDISDEIKGLKR